MVVYFDCAYIPYGRRIKRHILVYTLMDVLKKVDRIGPDRR